MTSPRAREFALTILIMSMSLECIDDVTERVCINYFEMFPSLSV
jgi:hypothetical protein